MDVLIQRLRRAAFLALRTPFRLLPLGPQRRDRARAWFTRQLPSLVPGHRRLTVATLPSNAVRRPHLRSDAPAVGHLGFRAPAAGWTPSATVVAFYLPQFHPIPENDAWWGAGFTEWRNVTRALPQFEGHAQPRLPGDLGFYDLRNTQVMHAQAELAKAYGIGAFCFYAYWFGGTTLLEAPLDAWRADASIDFPYCLCWANENWSRRWDGRAQDVLIAQQHSADDDLAFIAHIAPHLRDPRYLRVDGRPLLLVYRPSLLPDARATATRWRAWCRDHGIGEIAIANVHSFDAEPPDAFGFDFAVEFPPNLFHAPAMQHPQRLLHDDYEGGIVDWRDLHAQYMARGVAPDWLFPGVNCGWDNEPRRPARGLTYLYASPARYGQWLRHTIEHRLAGRAPQRRLVFVNAWNEWAEGAVLEPDMRLGHAWLEATRRALTAAPALPTRPCVVVHAWYADVLDEILGVLDPARRAMRLVITTSREREAAVRDVLARHGAQAEVEIHDNRGRDVLPFLHVAQRLASQGETLVLKLHTKRSPHRDDGARWRAELFERLAASARWAGIVDRFQQDAALGLVAAEGHIQPLGYFWGSNAANVDYLCRRLGIAMPDIDEGVFVAGTMFWVRLAAIAPLLEAHLGVDEFEREAGQVDGTLAHAVERVFVQCVLGQGSHMLDAAAASGCASRDAGGDYAYAARG